MAGSQSVYSTRRGDYRDYYDQQLIDGVTALYARDLELFDYSFEGSGDAPQSA